MLCFFLLHKEISMKSITLLFIACATLLNAHQVVNLVDLNDFAVQEFTQGKLKDYILECPEGASLPFQMVISGDFLAAESTSTLNILKTCFIRCEGEGHFLFSTDMQTWKEFSEFFTGMIKVSVVAQEGMPVAGLDIELNAR